MFYNYSINALQLSNTCSITTQSIFYNYCYNRYWNILLYAFWTDGLDDIRLALLILKLSATEDLIIRLTHWSGQRILLLLSRECIHELSFMTMILKQQPNCIYITLARPIIINLRNFINQLLLLELLFVFTKWNNPVRLLRNLFAFKDIYKPSL